MQNRLYWSAAVNLAQYIRTLIKAEVSKSELSRHLSGRDWEDLNEIEQKIAIKTAHNFERQPINNNHKQTGRLNYNSVWQAGQVCTSQRDKQVLRFPVQEELPGKGVDNSEGLVNLQHKERIYASGGL